MIPGMVLAGILALAAVLYVVAPLLRGDAAEAEQLSAVRSEVRDLHSAQEMYLASLKDLEDDRATGKVGDEDYRRMHDRLSVQAVNVMKQLDELQAREDERSRFDRPEDAPRDAPGSTE